MRMALTAVAAACLWGAAAAAPASQRPNILWITCEDISAHVGCYGDDYAVTPHIDRLATQGVRYTRAFAPIGVCAPARSCLITGMYPPSIGTQHMRCRGRLPAGVKTYAQVMREAGYFCTNNSKTDYNFAHSPDTWDQSGRKAHWRNRPDGKPFFAIFNLTSSHEAQIRLPEAAYRKRVRNFAPHELHDPARAPVPPYHPDTPEVRRDWARYADMITFMDKQVAGVLEELEADGLAGQTIVWFYSDHGAGMPRSKRWLYDSSLHVPFIIRFPRKWAHLAPGQPGSTTDRLVSFVDFGPTLLSLAGVDVPAWMQGVPFLGEQEGPPRRYVHGFRDRMDERYDMMRSVRDARYKYIRNFMPHRPWFGGMQYISYMHQMPTMQIWQKLYDAGKLPREQAMWFEPKPTEELYDTQADPHEIHNLAQDPAHREVLERMRGELRRWMVEIRDLGLLPEEELRTRFGQTPAYDAVRQDPALYPLQRLLVAADLANARDAARLDELVGLLARDRDPAERWWGAVGLGALGEAAAPAAEALAEALHDPAPAVRVAAAEALAGAGHLDEALPVLAAHLGHESEWVRLRAANALDALDEAASPVRAAMEKARGDTNGYVKRVMERALEAWEP